MGFDKAYFEHFGSEIRGYQQLFPGGPITATVKLVDGKEININRILKVDDERLTVAYYDPQKQRPVPKQLQASLAEPTALPVIAVPYSALLWVELHSGPFTDVGCPIGFKSE